VEWVSNKKKDDTANVTEDARYKQRDHFKALAAAVAPAAAATGAAAK